MVSDRWTHAFIGAAVTIVTAFVPFSPLIGGGVAGYIHEKDGWQVGALSGLIAAIPFALLVALAAAFFVIVPTPAEGLRFLLVLFAGTLLGTSVYTVAFGAVGGYVGEYLARER